MGHTFEPAHTREFRRRLVLALSVYRQACGLLQAAHRDDADAVVDRATEIVVTLREMLGDFDVSLLALRDQLAKADIAANDTRRPL